MISGLEQLTAKPILLKESWFDLNSQNNVLCYHSRVHVKFHKTEDIDETFIYLSRILMGQIPGNCFFFRIFPLFYREYFC